MLELWWTAEDVSGARVDVYADGEGWVVGLSGPDGEPVDNIVLTEAALDELVTALERRPRLEPPG